MSFGETPDLSIIIPTYQSAESIGVLVKSLADALSPLGMRYEVIFVNDGSNDSTWNTITEIAKIYPAIRGIDLLRNYGQPAATLCGLSAARGRLVATMDDDLEHRPDQLAVLIMALQAHPDWDAVVATWTDTRPPLRKVGSWVHRVSDLLAWRTPRGFHHTAFRVFRRSVCDALLEHHTRSPLIGPMLHQVSNRVFNVQVLHGERLHGRSGFSFMTGVNRVSANFRSGSVLPLTLISIAGTMFAILAILLGVMFLVRWQLGANTPTGWLSTLLVTTFFGGLTLLSVGVLGAYIGLIVKEVRQSPRWSIRTETASPIEG